MDARKIGGRLVDAPTELNRSTHFSHALKVLSLTASLRSSALSEAMSM